MLPHVVDYRFSNEEPHREEGIEIHFCWHWRSPSLESEEHGPIYKILPVTTTNVPQRSFQFRCRGFRVNTVLVHEACPIVVGENPDRPHDECLGVWSEVYALEQIREQEERVCIGDVAEVIDAIPGINIEAS